MSDSAVRESASTGSDEVIRLEGVRKQFGSFTAVHEANFGIRRGEFFALLGPSGCGKTTLLRTIAGFEEPTAGRILLDGKDQAGVPPYRRHVNTVFQQYALFPHMSVFDNVAFGLRSTKVPEADVRRRVSEMLDTVRLGEQARRKPSQLSGGQQQRVALAMAFACRPSVIVLDEPTTGLDVSTQEHVLATIRSLTREHGVAALYITHDLAVVADLADDVAVMYAGRVVEHGPVRQIFTSPAHPYTRHLVAAAPDIEGGRQIVGLAGRAPSPGKRPQGCAFALRCELATDECRSAFPAVVSVGERHTARCIKVGKVPTSTVAVPLGARTSAKGDPIVELKGVNAAYSGNVVVHDVTLTIRKGECLALVGESGSGKTTVSRAIGGLHREWDGEITFKGEPLGITSRKRTMAQRLGIQYVFQNPYGSLNPRRTVGDLIVRPLLIAGSSREEADKAILDVLDKVNLPASYSGKYPDQLSGGERQRVAIARALVSKPDVLVCDEVTSALDVLVQAAIVDLLGELRKSLGLAMLFVTHNLPLVRSIADEVAVMSQGRIVELGTAESVIGSPHEDYTRRLITATPSIARSMA